MTAAVETEGLGKRYRRTWALADCTLTVPAGTFDAYNLKTGDELYRQRLPLVGNGFSASPVAADGKIYLSNEDGDILVVAAGEKVAHLGTNSMGELLMATPASISVIVPAPAEPYTSLTVMRKPDGFPRRDGSSVSEYCVFAMQTGV